MKPFRDRIEAGQRLAKELNSRRWTNTCIITLPRGGVPVAAEAARQLHLPWDILVVKKIGSPLQPEFAIGAVAEDDLPVWNQEALGYMNIDDKTLLSLADETSVKVHDKANRWNQFRQPINVKNRNVILIDDGLATGLTMRAAIALLKRRGVSQITIAVPVAPQSAIDYFTNLVKEVIVLKVPPYFRAVGEWYEDFTQVSDEAVTALLQGVSKDPFNLQEISIPCEMGPLIGELAIPESPLGLILFAHGSGSSHRSTRNQKVARALNEKGFATLLFDLLTEGEALDRTNVFDINLLSQRLTLATNWSHKQLLLKDLPVGYFGASTGAAAALGAAAKNPKIQSVVSRGGRPDLAMEYLHQVKCPVLLVVGSEDTEVFALNKKAKQSLNKCSITLIEGASHLFEEPGTMDEVIEHAIGWFTKTLSPYSPSQHAEIGTR